MRDAVQRALDASGFTGATLDGIDAMWMVRFAAEDDTARFVALGLRDGVIFKRGAYNFAALAHDDAAVERIGQAAFASFTTLAKGAA